MKKNAAEKSLAFTATSAPTVTSKSKFWHGAQQKCVTVGADVAVNAKDFSAAFFFISVL